MAGGAWFPDDDGIESTNLVKRMGWRGPGITSSARDTTIGYARESLLRVHAQLVSVLGRLVRLDVLLMAG